MNFDVLRTKILEKAIRGELVPQLESEPEVEQIGKAPKDVPFAIPEKWKWCNFGNVVAYGKCEQVQPQNIEKNAWILDLEDIESGTGNLLQKKKNVSVQSNKSRFRKGDVLYGKLRPYLNKVIIADNDGYCTTEIIPISPTVSQVPLDAQYLKAYLMSPYFVEYANQCSYGVKMPRLGTKDAQKALFPIPSLEEQVRIVTKINQLFEQIDCAEKAYNMLSGPLSERFRQLCLEKAIQGKLVPQLDSEPSVEQIGLVPNEIPFTIPKTWEWVHLSSVLNKLTDGEHKTPKYEEDGIPFVSVKNISSGVLDFSDTKFISEEDYQKFKKRCNPEIGDILLSKVGTTGVPAIVKENKKFSLFVSVALLKLGKRVQSGFLWYCLQSPLVQDQAKTNTRGIGNKNWVLKAIGETIIPLPPLEEQNRIVQRLHELFREIDNIGV